MHNIHSWSQFYDIITVCSLTHKRNQRFKLDNELRRRVS